MPTDEMVTIHADILKVTPKFVTVRCGESEEILKLWEVEADEPLEAGQVDMALRIPKAEADALGLSVAEEMESAPESSLEEPEEADSNTHTEPTDLCPDETPEDEEDDPRPAHGHGSTWLRKDICEKSFPLSDDEKLELGDTMAKAQEKIDALEDELQSIRKSFKARIEEQQEILSKAAKEYRDGKTEPQKVECDVFQDWSTDELVYVTADEAAEEIMRRPMTDDEKRPTLFDAPPDGKGHSAPLGEDPRRQDTPAPTPPTWGHTCIDCTHMANGQDGAQAGECASCVQSGSGTLDNWQPRRECRTCNYSRTQIHMPPCNTCLRNVEERYRGDDDNWIWAGPGSAGNAPEDEASPGLTVDANAADVPPTLPDESSQGAALQ